MQSQWQEWLAAEKAAGRFGGTSDPIVRGEDSVITVDFDSDESASTFTGSIALSPDADSNIADFTVSKGAWDGSFMTVTFTLPAATVLPDDDNGNGLSEVLFSFEQDGARFIGGVISVSGVI